MAFLILLSWSILSERIGTELNVHPYWVDKGISIAAARLGCDESLIKAFIHIESSGRPFVHRFESHVFYELTGTYVTQFDKAYTIDSSSAIMARSSGAFQILGLNYIRCGFQSPTEFSHAMLNGEKQLRAAVRFIESDRVLHKAVQTKDYRIIAIRWNGPKHKDYDKRLFYWTQYYTRMK